MVSFDINIVGIYVKFGIIFYKYKVEYKLRFYSFYVV